MRQVIENGYLLAEIEDKGAELVRLYDKEKDREILWKGDPAFWGRHAPILFPNVGRHFGDSYRLGGKSYPSKQHGFARDSVFTCEQKGKESVLHQLLATEETRKVYPFDFCLRVTHILEGKKLHVYWEVVNPSKEDTMLFTIGAHPAFALPEEEAEHCQLLFPGKESLTYLLIDEGGSGCVRADIPHTLKLQDSRAELSVLKDGDTVLADHFFDKDALVFDGNAFEEVSILLPDGTPLLTMHARNFPNFGIWSAPRAPFVCLEPWMGRADDFGFEGDLSDKPGILTLAPEGIYRKTYDIEIG